MRRLPKRTGAKLAGLATIVLAAYAAAPETAMPTADAPAVTVYRGGQVFDGDDFVQRDLWVAGGRLIADPGRPAGETIDLDGAYVLPGLAEAHHHTVLCDPGRIGQFLDAGIVWAGIMNARVSSRGCQAELHDSSGVEVMNALAGVTAPESHPTQIGRYFLDESEIDGEWVHHVDGPDAVGTVWPRIAATEPDIVKVFLSYSEAYDQLRADPDMPAWYRGLDPDAVAPLVARAHAAGLRVAAHVMSAHDFDVAVAAGVDVIAHTPGFAPGNAFTPDDPHPWLTEIGNDPARYVITEAVARRAAERDVAVMTTVSGAETPNAFVRANIARLRASGVTLLVGSDRGEFNSVDEAVYLVEQGLVPADEVVASLAVDTPRFLFPDRAIGGLAPGDEATFVVIDGDPLADIAALREVRRVVKAAVE